MSIEFLIDEVKHIIEQYKVDIALAQNTNEDCWDELEWKPDYVKKLEQGINELDELRNKKGMLNKKEKKYLCELWKCFESIGPIQDHEKKMFEGIGRKIGYIK